MGSLYYIGKKNCYLQIIKEKGSETEYTEIKAEEGPKTAKTTIKYSRKKSYGEVIEKQEIKERAGIINGNIIYDGIYTVDAKWGVGNPQKRIHDVKLFKELAEASEKPNNCTLLGIQVIEAFKLNHNNLGMTIVGNSMKNNLNQAKDIYYLSNKYLNGDTEINFIAGVIDNLFDTSTLYGMMGNRCIRGYVEETFKESKVTMEGTHFIAVDAIKSVDTVKSVNAIKSVDAINSKEGIILH
ncbi:MAG TPA: hypothetical protein DCP90_02120 [Clostridiales bacterium]|nr:MAG: hypothetical protein A2Y22_08540 [Clostridiales bacterium GWD2_32_59]HAN09390.1 hypothetical protein [Clostridiales bacterium]